MAKGDAVAKRWLCGKVKDLIQTARGKKIVRQPFVPAMTVYQKARGGALHSHVLIHVARGNLALERIADGSIIDVKPAVEKHIDYITAHRLPLSPEFEATTTHRRKSSDPIRGVLLSFNKDAKQIWKIVGLISETKKSPS